MSAVKDPGEGLTFARSLDEMQLFKGGHFICIIYLPGQHADGSTQTRSQVQKGYSHQKKKKKSTMQFTP